MNDDRARPAAVFHDGELAVQARTGERAAADRHAPMIAGRLSEPARAFVTRQDIVALSALDAGGAPWASLWRGAPGFLTADAYGGRLVVSAGSTATDAADPVLQHLSTGAPVGALVIDFATRQRLRVNGVVVHASHAAVEIAVREAFGNCVKYIRRRTAGTNAAADGGAARAAIGVSLGEEQRGIIARADTMFVASLHPDRGLDVSHRGGPSGFVRVIDGRTLRVPDYRGNSLFQTLGNFEADARAGLAVLDFDGHRLLSLTGHAVTSFDGDDQVQAPGATGRYWTLTIDRWIQFPFAPGASWTLIEDR